ncbi:hypothetical protein MSG28_013867 [Choristoneura fumiferana]|uniref:Uncharacterized protein n=1 Tax=Choristoneura fumiferana TaxID=7141 RepID=A0ACC0K9P1_CHOFU|nr:hypothetical protein MSG28_013867 [Choristoneura fumiferana]
METTTRRASEASVPRERPAKINPRTNADELFCSGAVIGSRFVLTTAKCALAHRRSDLWVQLPGDSRQYPVNTTVRHNKFHSGTQAYDVAFLLLNEDVEWPEGKQENLGACLGLKTPLEGDCVAITFDDSDQLKFTPLTVTTRSCSQQGSTDDAACGRAFSGGCSVAPGSPVMCPSGASKFIHDEVIGGRKWPELFREKHGAAMPLFVRLGGGTAVPPNKTIIGHFLKSNTDQEHATRWLPQHAHYAPPLCSRDCPTKLTPSDDLIIAGLVRQVCKQDATLLGSLMPSAEWITDQLTNLTLATSQYTYKL